LHERGYIMKIVVTSTGPSLDDQVEPRFGRAPYYVFVDTDTMEFETTENPNMAAGGGAGIQSAQLVAERGVTFVLTGNCGPNAFNVFGAAGIQIIVGVRGTVRQAVEQFTSGAYDTAAQPNVESHFGVGGGMGGGRGMGGGMGRGTGGGRGMGRSVGQPGNFGYPAPPQQSSRDEELAVLKEQSQMLLEQLKNIQDRIEKLDKKK